MARRVHVLGRVGIEKENSLIEPMLIAYLFLKSYPFTAHRAAQAKMRRGQAFILSLPFPSYIMFSWSSFSWSSIASHWKVPLFSKKSNVLLLRCLCLITAFL